MRLGAGTVCPQLLSSIWQTRPAGFAINANHAGAANAGAAMHLASLVELNSSGHAMQLIRIPQRTWRGYTSWES